jgi:hypothetical protein
MGDTLGQPASGRCRRAALAKAESLGGTRVMGPEQIMETVELGQFTDPEGT